jgi:hypothetical protein
MAHTSVAPSTLASNYSQHTAATNTAETSDVYESAAGPFKKAKAESDIQTKKPPSPFEAFQKMESFSNPSPKIRLPAFSQLSFSANNAIPDPLFQQLEQLKQLQQRLDEAKSRHRHQLQLQQQHHKRQMEQILSLPLPLSPVQHQFRTYQQYEPQTQGALGMLAVSSSARQ